MGSARVRSRLRHAAARALRARGARGLRDAAHAVAAYQEPPPPPPPPPPTPPEKPLPPEPAGVDCSVPTVESAKPLIELLNASALNGADEWYHDTSGWSARPSKVFAQRSTTPKTIAY